MSLNNQLLMMEKYHLDTEEVFVIDLLFQASAEEGHVELLNKYFTIEIDRSVLGSLLERLQMKGIIAKSYKIPAKGMKFDPECVIFNQNFLHNYRKFSGELGAELLKVYPHFLNIGGVAYDIANFAKKFHSEEEFFYRYGKEIGWKLDKHNEVISLVKWAKENTNYLNYNICDFVISKAWTKIKELKDGNFNNLSFDPTIQA